MKTIIALSLLGLSLSSYGSFFWQDFDSIKTVSLNFTSRQSSDLAMFEEMYSRTQSELRQEMVREAVELMKAGASGKEALQMIMAFDDQVFDKRLISRYGIGQLIGKFFRSEMDAIYESYMDEGGEKKIEFIDNRYSSKRAQYSVHIDWGARAGARLYAVLKITNLENGASRQVSHSVHNERIRTMGYMLASKLFHSLHRTRFPVIKNKNHVDKLEFHRNKPIRLSKYTSFRKKAEMAQKYCQLKKMRLATVDEMNELFAYGYYHGGLAIGSRQMGWAAQKSSYDRQPTFVNSDYPFGNRSSNSDIYLNVNYICVKNLVSGDRYL